MNIIQRIKMKLFKKCIIGDDNVIDIQCRYRGRFIVNGNHNNIHIAKTAKISDLNICMAGDGNTLNIDHEARIMGPCKITMQGKSKLHIGRNAGVRGVEFLVKDGCVDIGDLVMFSYGINIRNTDSHRIFRLESPGAVINPSKDIVIGKHVWVGMNATILKGVNIGNDSIVAYGAVVTHDCPNNAIIAGNPAKVVKTGITWDY